MIGRRREPAPDWPRDPDWYRVSYQLATLYLNKATAIEEASGDRYSAEIKARDATSGLARMTAHAREDLADVDAQLVEFLRTTIEPSAIVLFAGALLFGPSEPVSPVERSTQRRRSHSEVVQLLDQEDPDPIELVTFVQEDYDELAPRVLYNLACFYTRILWLDEAAQWLERAIGQTPLVERPALWTLIDTDATLASLREDDARMEPIRKLRDAGTSPPERSSRG